MRMMKTGVMKKVGYYLRGIVEKDDFGKSEEKSSETNTISR